MYLGQKFSTLLDYGDFFFFPQILCPVFGTVPDNIGVLRRACKVLDKMSQRDITVRIQFF